jgi:hypothetical protein
MAGKFLLLEEVAKQLGVTADEVHRLVERKKLFPLRDGATLKFKIDEIERLAAEANAADEPSGLGLELDLDDALPAAEEAPRGGTVDLELADSVVVGGNAGPTAADPDSLVLGGSGSLAGGPISGAISAISGAISGLSGAGPLGAGVAGGNRAAPAGPVADDELAMTMLGTGDAIGGLDALDLDLDSIVGLSSPALAGAAAAPAGSGPAGPLDSGTLAIDLSGVGVGSQPSNATGSNATGSLVFGSDVNAAAASGPLTDAGAALSGALDSGLSLEDGDAAVSGIDLGPLDEGLADDGLLEEGGANLAGEVFDLGGLGNDDESASVVLEEPESGDSSFFPTSSGESSDFTGDLPMSADVIAGGGVELAGDVVPDTKFSVWQICGLVCCTLLLLTGGFVMFDLMQTIGSSGDLTLLSPLLNPLSSIFGWR